MIIMGVMLRPTLMIFGLVGSIILVNIMILLMKTMFNYAAGIVANESTVGPIAMIVLFCLYVWLSIKVVHRALDFINEVPSGIMKWIGGGHDPLDANVGQQGNSFIGGVINKGEGSAQAAGAAGKGLKDKARSQKMADEGKAADVANNERLISAISGSKTNETSTTPTKSE